MWLRQIKNSQVKCNFCMQWMTLKTEVKYNLNICNDCLIQGCDHNNLHGISSKGELYHIYMVKTNTILPTTQNLATGQQYQLKKIQEVEDTNETMESIKIDFLQQIDEYRNTEIKDIVWKWNIVTQFLQQKQSLSVQQIQYLKKLCNQKSAQLKKINSEFPHEIQSFKSKLITVNKNPLDEVEIINIMSNKSKQPFQSAKKTMNMTPQKKKKSIQGKENYIKYQGQKGVFKNLTDLKPQATVNIKFTSPKKQNLKQKDLNSIDIDICKFSDLKQNNETVSKCSNTSFFDFDSVIGGSNVKKSLNYPLKSIRSSRTNSFLNSLSKNQRDQIIKKYEAVRFKILKYLQKNYESSSLTRLMLNSIFEAYENTSLIGKSLQLVSYNLSHIDFKGFLEAFEWNGIEVLKLVKTKLSDEFLEILLQFIFINKVQIKVLVLSNNKLTEKSIKHLCDKSLDSINQIYLGRNRIKREKVKDKIVQLSNKLCLYL